MPLEGAADLVHDTAAERRFELGEERLLLESGLRKLARRERRIVQLRFFGGLSVEETAEVLGVSPITVMREWKSAKAWLYRELAGPTANGQ